MISIFTFPVITALLEPIILKTKFQWIHLALGALVIVGILFLVPTQNNGASNFPVNSFSIIMVFNFKHLTVKRANFLVVNFGGNC